MQHKLFEDSSKLILNIKKEGLKLNENAENAHKSFLHCQKNILMNTIKVLRA